MHGLIRSTSFRKHSVSILDYHFSVFIYSYEVSPNSVKTWNLVGTVFAPSGQPSRSILDEGAGVTSEMPVCITLYVVMQPV